MKLTPVDELRAIVETRIFEGLPFRTLGRRVQVGDTYLAARNTGPHLLTAMKVVDGYVIPVENAYAFDLHECVAIEFEIE